MTKDSGAKTNILPKIKTLYKKEIHHNFSSTTSLDTFRLAIVGDSITQAEIRFEIVDFNGVTLLDESYPARYLLDYGYDELISEENYIKSRIDSFFDEGNFRRPAIDFDRVFYEDYSDLETWTDIKSDSTSIGFYYLIGEEDGRHIAYSKKLEKVVLYFNCC